ncbi:DUF4169 family protein [Aliiroseovarius marinus]|uniref:DUF4169 family protein n=1 Tax=Aliiroseovarius marinus TaxID=2500159 RepID=UPI003D7D6B91
MKKPVNLNRFRKEKARAANKARADENAVKYGRSKAQKRAETSDKTRARAVLDAHKLDPKS